MPKFTRQKDIIAGNKLLAEFMVGKSYISKAGVYVRREVFCISKREYLIDRLEYHSSWDWLMPVIDKIEKIKLSPEGNNYQITISQNSCKIIESAWKHGYHCASIFNREERRQYSKLEITWRSIVEFIKWHNQNKKS